MGCLKFAILFVMILSPDISRLGRFRDVSTCFISFRYFLKSPAYDVFPDGVNFGPFR